MLLRGSILAAAIALIFAIEPYHFSRGEQHLFLSAYFLVPVGVGLALTLLEVRFGTYRNFATCALHVTVTVVMLAVAVPLPLAMVQLCEAPPLGCVLMVTA